MARSSRHKLVRYVNGTEALFDLVDDPCEQTNLLPGDAGFAPALSTQSRSGSFMGSQLPTLTSVWRRRRRRRSSVF
jgi:hypothetical protein